MRESEGFGPETVDRDPAEQRERVDS